ncbi:DLW-39 family protein [Pseudactinotalea sp.]
MKRVLVLAAVAAAAVLAWRALEEKREQRDLWTEVTDPLP